MRAALALAALAVLAGQAAAAAPRGACVKPRVGFLGPLTGPAAFLGKEQVVAARAAVREHGAGAVRLVEADTQLQPKRAAAAARALRANPQVLAVVGPAGSQEVLAVAPVFSRGERVAFVSASALDAGLTNGSIPSFFRVVPSDRAQAPTVVRMLRRTLKARSVAVVDDGTTYSRRLADRVQAGLRAGGVRVSRQTADPSRTAFAALVSRLPAADAVFLPWHVAATAQLFAQEVRRQRPRAAIVGGDALDSRDFTLAGAYVTTFARDFGPPAATAAEVAARAVRAACADGTATRREVLERIRATDLPRTEDRGRLRFTRHGDLRGAAYTVLRLA